MKCIMKTQVMDGCYDFIMYHASIIHGGDTFYVDVYSYDIEGRIPVIQEEYDTFQEALDRYNKFINSHLSDRYPIDSE